MSTSPKVYNTIVFYNILVGDCECMESKRVNRHFLLLCAILWKILFKQNNLLFVKITHTKLALGCSTIMMCIEPKRQKCFFKGEAFFSRKRKYAWEMKKMTKDRTLICFPKLLSYYVCDAKIVFISRQAQGRRRE